MATFPTIQAVLDSLAKAVGVDSLPANADGGVPLTVGEDTTVILYGEDPATILAAAPVAELPKTLDYGSAQWLLRRNFYDSPIAPFRVACDTAGNLVVWGRIPVDGMTGEQLAKLLDAIATEAELIRSELGIGVEDEEE
jgi:hypothetical protein